MKLLLVTLASFLCISVFAQNDKIYLHDRQTVEGSVVKVTEFTVIFKYINEDAEQTVSKYAVAKIIYGKSGRSEKVSDKIIVTSKDDWEEVVILEDKSQVAGLTKGDEVKGKTATMYNFHSSSGNDRKAVQKLKEDAAEIGCPFILLTSEKNETRFSKQAIKKGIAYKY